MKSAINSFVRIKKINVNNKCHWYCSKLSDLKKERDYYNKRAIITNDGNDWLNSRLNYNQTRNKFVNELRNAESNYYKNIIRDNIGNQKKYVENIKRPFGSK